MVEFFIRRPIFATVCALLIVLAGAVSIPSIPISLYPQLAPPVVVVTSNYVGANAQTVESAVTIPLETAINGVPGMRYMSSLRQEIRYSLGRKNKKSHRHHCMFQRYTACSDRRL